MDEEEGMVYSRLADKAIFTAHGLKPNSRIEFHIRARIDMIFNFHVSNSHWSKYSQVGYYNIPPATIKKHDIIPFWIIHGNAIVFRMSKLKWYNCVNRHSNTISYRTCHLN